MASTTSSLPGADQLPGDVAKILGDFVEAAKKNFAERLTSIVLFGSAAEGRMRATSDVNVIVVLKEFRQQDVTDLAPVVRMARAAIRLEVMYLLGGEVPAAMECFAQKFADVSRRHRVLHGPDPFEGLTPSRGAEIYRLRQVIFNLQLRMREGFVERAGQEDQVAALLAEISGPLRTCAAALARLENQGNFSPKEALERLAGGMGRPDAARVVHEISELRERHVPEGGDLAASFFQVLEIVETIRKRAWSLE
jgi:predicted nucleotidyltransferase